MSDKIIGIDLGTTNSCISIQGACPQSYKVKDLPGFTVVTDKLKRKIFPSVVYYTGDPQTPCKVAHSAKRTVGKYALVMFAKRHMGSDKKFQVADDRFMTPVEVSSEILKFLRSVAEEALGEKIGRAVVTVPAYFGNEQVRCTREAMKEAGFRMDSDQYIIREPDAAAFMYATLTGADDLKVLVYDLGGGTFDVTVLVKEGLSIEAKANGGDQALGGFNFDVRLANHVLQLLRDQGYKLNLDPDNNPEDAVTFSKLLLLVEALKRELSKDVEATLDKTDAFADQEGNSVDISLDISRETFEGLIEDLVDLTIQHAVETLAKTNLAAEDLDQIIMVGGSSYIPLVQEKLARAFGREPLLVEPDLAVSLGAAIYASHAIGTVSQDKVRLTLEKMPARTDLDDIDVCGTVCDLAGKPLPGYQVEVSDAGGAQKGREKVDGEGRFMITVDLSPNAENRFTVTVYNPQGEAEVQSGLAVIHSKEGEGDVLIGNPVCLAKAITIKTLSDFEVLVPEGTPLPHIKEKNFYLNAKGELDRSKTQYLDVDIYEEGRRLGTIHVSDIPSDVSLGEAVEVKLMIARDQGIEATAFIPSAGCAGRTKIDPKPLEIKDRQTLQTRLDELSEEWRDLQMVLSADELAQHAVAINRDFKRARQCLAETGGDLTEASSVLERLKNLLPLLQPVKMDPPREVFDQLYAKALELVEAAEAKSEEFRQMNFADALHAIKQQADAAYQQKNQGEWEVCERRVHNIAQKAVENLQGPKPPSERPDPRQMIVQVMNQIMELEGNVMAIDPPDKQELLAKLKEAKTELDEVRKEKDLDLMWDSLVAVYHNNVVPVIESLKQGSQAGGDGADGELVVSSKPIF